MCSWNKSRPSPPAARHANGRLPHGGKRDTLSEPTEAGVHAGDGGSTRLPGGVVVAKSDPRLEAAGVVDELVCALGIARAALAEETLRADLLRAQKDLFLIGAECAAGPERAAALPTRLGPPHCQALDRWTAALESRAKAPRDFVLPGESLPAAHVDFARAVARRCERRLVALSEKGHLDNPHILRWSNRLSTALWLVARVVENQSHRPRGS